MVKSNTHSDCPSVDRTPRLPTELRSVISDYNADVDIEMDETWSTTDRPSVACSATDSPMDPEKVSLSFLDLPIELRSQIYQYLLPNRKKIVEPSTDSKEETQTRDLMVLNRQICVEVSVILYEGYTFTVNVHEGVTEGGIEFLNSGRQRIQYRENFSQVRFKRFEGGDDPFGFHRIKRLHINVHHSAPGNTQERKFIRHFSMHTHFMMRALVKLLRHNDGGFRLNYLKVTFVEGPHYRSQTVNVTQHWYNWATKAPLGTSIHGISNVEIIARPLMNLRGVQKVDFELDRHLLRDDSLSNFISRVSTVITSKFNAPIIADELDSKIERARDALEDWLYREKLSGQVTSSVAGLSASDFMDTNEESWGRIFGGANNNQVDSNNFDGVYGSSLLPDEDGYFDLPSCEMDLANLKRMDSSVAEDFFLTYGSNNTYEMRTVSARDDIEDFKTRAKLARALDRKGKSSVPTTLGSMSLRQRLSAMDKRTTIQKEAAETEEKEAVTLLCNDEIEEPASSAF